MALPFPRDDFDAAIMALVIFFVLDPAKGVAEMARVVRPGGSVSAYAWDIPGNGAPVGPIRSEMLAMGLNPPVPPSFEASRIDALRTLWTDAGLENIETRKIVVERTFADFDDFWTTNIMGPGISSMISAMPVKDTEELKVRVKARLPAEPTGRVVSRARANVVKGAVPFP